MENNLKNLILGRNIILFILFLLTFFLIYYSFKPSYSLDISTKSSDYGIKVDANGNMLLNNTYFKAMGLNGFNFVINELNIASNSRLGDNPQGYKSGDYEEYFRLLSQYKIPFVRLTFGGFHETAYNIFDKSDNHEEYFDCADKIVRAAEKNNVGLIVDFFWYIPTEPYHSGEHVVDLANPDSQSIKYQEMFVKAIINRYKTSPAIWGYEVGNEYNLAADLSNNVFHFTISDGNEVKNHITTNELSEYYKIISNIIRREDPTRFITTGDALVRDAAYSLYQVTKDINYSNHTSWTTAALGWDYTGADDYKTMIKKFNVGEINVISTHIYKDAESMSNYISMYEDVARELKKPIYIGEFGGPYTLEDVENLFSSEIATIKNSSVQLSSPWLCDSAGRFLTESEFFIESKKDFYLSKIREYNSEYQTVFDDAWNAWKKKITVNVNNANYNITKTNDYDSESKNNATSSFYLVGDKVKVNSVAHDSYSVENITVNTVSGSNVEVSNNEFTMPNDDIVITITTKKINLDNTMPTCNVSINNNSISIEQNTDVIIQCTDASGIVDLDLESDNFKLNNLQINNITKESITDGVSYKINVKGIGVGDASITLKVNTISDNAGNYVNSDLKGLLTIMNNIKDDNINDNNIEEKDIVVPNTSKNINLLIIIFEIIFLAFACFIFLHNQIKQ